MMEGKARCTVDHGQGVLASVNFQHIVEHRAVQLTCTCGFLGEGLQSLGLSLGRDHEAGVGLLDLGQALLDFDDLGVRKIPFTRELYIDQDDFMEEPAPKFFRLAPGREVRLRSAYFITCTGVVKDADGRVVELRATYTLFAEGCRGSLTKTLINRFGLANACDPQTYGIGIKELWEVAPEKHKAGSVTHTAGWPMP